MERKWKVRLSIILMVFILMFSQWNGIAVVVGNTVYAAEEDHGTPDNPILISTAVEFDKIRDNLDKHYKLDADIDLSSFTDWTPIGTEGNEFTGSLDGSGYHIKNVTITDVGSINHVGLFGSIKGGKIRNLTLEDVQIVIDPTIENVITGSLAGEIEGTEIDNVHIASGSVSGGIAKTGGFSGEILASEISNSSVNIAVKGSDFIGGFAGTIEDSTVKNSFSLGNVSAYPGTNANIGGGLVGQLDNSNLQRVYANGDVTDTVTYAGGLIGQLKGSNSEISDAYATGDVKQAKAYIGGLIGHIVDVKTIKNTLAVGTIIPDEDSEKIGGLIGLNESGTEISSSYWNIDTYETSDGGTGLTTSEMGNYLSFKGWDTNTIWQLPGDEAYPTLRLVKNIKIEPNSNDDVKLQYNSIHFDEINETYELKFINGKYSDIYYPLPKSDLSFSSSDESVASINSNGEITAKKAGAAEIYVQYPGRTLVLHIYVHEQLSDDYALKFDGKQDGTGSFVKVKHDESLRNTKDFTVEAWVNWDGTDGYRVFLSKPETATTTGWAFVINDGRPEFHAQLDAYSSNNPVYLFESIEANTWTHLAFSYNASSGYAKLYVNGERKLWTSWGITNILQKDDTPLLIGREFENDLPERSFGGYIDNVRIWNTVLSDATVADWTKRTNLIKHPNYTSLVGHWNFNEGNGDIAADSSRYGNHGMLMNYAQWVDREDNMRLSGLNQAIEIAEQKLNDHPEGFEIGEAPPEARQDLQDAIEVAKETVRNSVGKTDEEINDAVNALEAAIRTFEERVVTEHSVIEFSGGEGTIDSPYLIENPEQLNKVRGNLSAHYKLIQDINLAEWDWIPIGTDMRPFQGGFDGNGKVISNLTINLPDQDGVGLFGKIGGSSYKTYIKNVGLENVNIKGDRFVGALVGHVILGGSGGKKVSNSYVKNGNVTAGYGTAGGLIGALGQAEELQNSYAVDVNVEGSTTVGGLVGIQNGNMENVYSIGEVKPTYFPEYNIGGLVGSSFVNAKNENAYWSTVCDRCDFTNSFGEETPVEQLKQRDTFKEWDFNSTWLLYDGFDMMPKLRVFHPLEKLVANVEKELVEEEDYFLPGDTAQVYVSAKHKGLDAFDLTGNQAVTYEVVSGEAVIDVTETGKITAKHPGNAKLSVQLGSEVKELTIDVDQSVPDIPKNLIVPDTAHKGLETVQFTWDEPDKWGIGTEKRYDLQFFDGSSWGDSIRVDVPSYKYMLPMSINTDEAKFRVRSVTNKGKSEFVESATFVIDNTAPTIEFETNGSETWSNTASTNVMLEDNLSGINTDSLYYLWSQSAKTPSKEADWQEFALDEKLSLDGVNGNWYLHVKVKDNAGNETFSHSKRFMLDSIAPTKPEIVLSHDVEDWLTNPPVKFTVTPGEDEAGGSGVEKTMYRIKHGEDDWSKWELIVDEPISVTEDGITIIAAKTMDAAGNESKVVEETIKIDTQTPKKPKITLSENGWSQSEVRVTLENDGETVSGHHYMEYTTDLDITDWTKYADPFSVDTNGKTTIYARSVSKAGTKSEEAEAIVKIDKGIPTINVNMNTMGDGEEYTGGSWDNRSWTNQDVRLSAEITNEISEIQKSIIIFNGINLNFDGTKIISDEGEHFIAIEAINQAGGSQLVGPYFVSIDKTAPGAPKIKPTTTEWANEPVTVEIEHGSESGGSGVHHTEYKIGEKGEWQTYNEPFQITTEGEHYIYARTWDNAGNVTPDLATAIVRIATTEPSITVDAKTEDGKVYESDTWTNQTVSLEANYQTETEVPLKKEYSIDDNTWVEYKEAITITKEGKTVIRFRTEDEAGNVSNTIERIVKIDRTAPSQPTIDLSHDDWTNEAVTVTLTAGNDETSESPHVMYQVGDGEWVWYTEPFKINTNGKTKINAKTVDQANNESDSVSETVLIEQRSPKVMIQGEKTIIMEEGTTYKDEGAKAVHERFGDLTDEIETDSDLDANKPGTYTITYTVIDQAGNKAHMSRSIHVIGIEEIEFGSYDSLVEEKETIQLKVKPIYLNEGVPSITHAPLFQSNDESIATVDKNGLIHFHKAGEVAISITYGPIQEKLHFTVDNGIIDLVEKREVLAGKTYTVQGTGAEIKMPVDLPKGTMISVEKNDADDLGNPDLILVGDSLTVTFHFPEGAPLPKGNYTLVMSFSEQANPDKVGIYYYNERAQKWEYRGGDVDKENRRITLHVAHFSDYAVFEEQEDESESSNDIGKGNKDGEKQVDDAEYGNEEGKNSSKFVDYIGKMSNRVSKDGEGTPSENKLPETATSIYNWLFVGGVLLFVGLFVLFARKQKTK